MCIVWVGCQEKNKPSPTPPPSPQVNQPQPTAGAPATGTPATTGSVLPGNPNVKATLPPTIPESLRRPLTREEIERLPPPARDMILRAQGRLSPTPTTTPKPSPSATRKP